MLDVGRQDVSERPMDDPFGHPAPGQIGQGGEHRRPWVRIDQHNPHPAAPQSVASLLARESAADDDYVFLH
jgi:hypothetical protein